MSIKSEMELQYRKECVLAKGTVQTNKYGTKFFWDEKKNCYFGMDKKGIKWVMSLQSRIIPMYAINCHNKTRLLKSFWKETICHVENMVLLSDHQTVIKCRDCHQDILIDIKLDPTTPQYDLQQRMMRGE